MKDFIKEFRQFALRGNVVDLAVGIIIGGAFQKITTSFVNDIVLAAINPYLSSKDFNSIKWGGLSLGKFLGATFDFLIVAFFVFLLVKAINAVKKERKKEDMSKQEQLLTEIKGLLQDIKKK